MSGNGLGTDQCTFYAEIPVLQEKRGWAGGVVLFGERDRSLNSFVLFPASVYFWYFMSWHWIITRYFWIFDTWDIIRCKTTWTRDHSFYFPAAPHWSCVVTQKKPFGAAGGQPGGGSGPKKPRVFLRCFAFSVMVLPRDLSSVLVSRGSWSHGCAGGAGKWLGIWEFGLGSDWEC